MALKLRATRSPAQEWWTNVSCPSGHDTTASFRTRAPASFKRLLGSAAVSEATPLCGPVRASLGQRERAYLAAFGFQTSPGLLQPGAWQHSLRRSTAPP